MHVYIVETQDFKFPFEELKQAKQYIKKYCKLMGLYHKESHINESTISYSIGSEDDNNLITFTKICK